MLAIMNFTYGDNWLKGSNVEGDVNTGDGLNDGWQAEIDAFAKKL